MASSAEYQQWMQQCNAQIDAYNEDIKKLEKEIGTLDEYMDAVQRCNREAQAFFDARGKHCNSMYSISADDHCVIANSFYNRKNIFVYNQKVYNAIDSLADDKTNIRNACRDREDKISELNAKISALQQNYIQLQNAYQQAVQAESQPPPESSSSKKKK